MVGAFQRTANRDRIYLARRCIAIFTERPIILLASLTQFLFLALGANFFGTFLLKNLEVPKKNELVPKKKVFFLLTL